MCSESLAQACRWRGTVEAGVSDMMQVHRDTYHRLESDKDNGFTVTANRFNRV